MCRLKPVGGVIVCAIIMEWDTLNMRLQHLFLVIYKYNNLYVEIFGWCASTQKGDLQKLNTDGRQAQYTKGKDA